MVGRALLPHGPQQSSLDVPRLGEDRRLPGLQPLYRAIRAIERVADDPRPVVDRNRSAGREGAEEHVEGVAAELGERHRHVGLESLGRIGRNPAAGRPRGQERCQRMPVRHVREERRVGGGAAGRGLDAGRQRQRMDEPLTGHPAVGGRSADDRQRRGEGCLGNRALRGVSKQGREIVLRLGHREAGLVLEHALIIATRHATAAEHLLDDMGPRAGERVVEIDERLPVPLEAGELHLPHVHLVRKHALRERVMHRHRAGMSLEQATRLHPRKGGVGLMRVGASRGDEQARHLRGTRHEDVERDAGSPEVVKAGETQQLHPLGSAAWHPLPVHAVDVDEHRVEVGRPRMPKALLHEEAGAVILDEPAAEDVIVDEATPLPHVDEPGQRRVTGIGGGAEVGERVFRREPLAEVQGRESVAILFLDVLQVPEAANHVGDVGPLVLLAVAHVERLEHVTSVGHPPALDGREEVVDVPAAVGGVERHAVDTLFPPREVGRVVACRLAGEHPRTLGRTGTEVLERDGPVPAHRRRRVVGLVGGAIDLGTSRHEQRSDALLAREDPAGIRLLVPCRILARHPRLAPQRCRRAREERDVPLDLGVDHGVGRDDDPPAWVLAVPERHAAHAAAVGILLHRHWVQIREHGEARQAAHLSQRLAEKDVEGGEVALTVVAAMAAEPGGEPRDNVVLEREPAEIPHRQVAVRIDAVRGEATDVAGCTHDPDRGNAEPSRRDHGSRAGARASHDEQPRGVVVACRDERMGLRGVDDRRAGHDQTDGDGGRRHDAPLHGHSTPVGIHRLPARRSRDDRPAPRHEGVASVAYTRQCSR